MSSLSSMFFLGWIARWGSPFPPWIYWLSVPTLLFCLSGISRHYQRSRALPPGPRGLPIIGNALQFPTHMPWIKYGAWAKEFGPIFSLDLAGQTVVVLNTFKVASDLLDGRSNIYSDRPRLVMAGEILAGGMSLLFAPYGPLWRKLRRAVHDGFGPHAVERYRPIHYREAALLVLRLLEKPDPHKWENDLERAVTGGILSALYGWPSIGDKEEALVKRLRAHAAKLAASAMAGAHLVDIFPLMKHLPVWMAKWKRDGLAWHETETNLLKELNRDAKEQISSRNSTDSFISVLTENADKHALSEKEAAWLSEILLIGASEPVTITLVNFVMAMELYPDVMHKAQNELDSVVGRERIPTFEDQEHLPYIQALIREVVRWRPAAPIGICVPRRVTEDNWYNGYLIPKGSIIVVNAWTMNRDPAIFPDFEEFRPERFLTDMPKDTHSMGHASFGFGRRICAGYNFAMQSLFITIAIMLWAVNIEKHTDADGNSITPPRDAFTDTGMVMAPQQFQCKMKPRFSDAVSILGGNMVDG